MTFTTGWQMKNYLEVSEIYHSYQYLGGFFGARLRAFRSYLDFKSVSRIFDVGCGPGHIAKYIPRHIEYIGFDVERRYIDFANRNFGVRGKFYSRIFDDSAADEFGRPT